MVDHNPISDWIFHYAETRHMIITDMTSSDHRPLSIGLFTESNSLVTVTSQWKSEPDEDTKIRWNFLG
jgi:hypothetical protein